MLYVFTDECDEPHELDLDQVEAINWWPDELCLVVMKDGSEESFMLGPEAFCLLDDTFEKHREKKSGE